MKSLTKISPDPGQKEYNVVNRDATDTYIHPKSPYPTDGSLFLLDEDANVLDKNVDSYPAGTIKAYGFKAGDGNYYAVDTETISDYQEWGGFQKVINNVLLTEIESEALKDYRGEHNTIEILTQLNGYNDGYIIGAPAAESCRARSFNGKQGFLPAIGQFYDFYSYKSEVDSLATKFSLDAFPTDKYYWTSTQWSTENSWNFGWRNGGISHGLRSTSVVGFGLRVRAFFAL